MAGYNKNLYAYAIRDAGDSFCNKNGVMTFSRIFMYVSMLYEFILLAIVLIGTWITYDHYSGIASMNENVKINDLRVFGIWISIATAFVVASFVLSLLGKAIPTAICGLGSAIINISVTAGQFDTATFSKFVLQHLLPSLLVMAAVIVFFIIVTARNRSYKKKYDELSAKLYKSLQAKHPDETVSNAELEKAMNEYKGEEIKIKYKNK